ncbi:DNA polymerase III subunit delta [Methylobrevis albus]|uniref:DNA-directed DNA polymerase n=1 Tax=Methylobrevis albus TaxID=2793297 RepID=A0A931I115_9HYPH|nr:DNA polymerase III subunit delta [Methylobrevis albus]MBH0237792.1 DNA polymerase III subunit delta [Methylobrevis albus]
MVAAKANEADRIVDRPPESVSFYLVYGPDAGLVAERAARLARARIKLDDPFALIRLDGAAIGSDPNRLADEAYAIPMFGGARAIWIRDAGGRANIAPTLTRLMRDPPPETTIVIEAGDLKKSSPIRTLFEKEKLAYAIPCFADDGAAVARLIDDEVRAAGLAISGEARQALGALLGGDRLASRGEVTKLCLYAHGRGRIELADVEAVVGDAAAVTMDEIVDAAATGDIPALSAALARAEGDGIRADVLCGAVLRHFQMLDLARADVDAGKRPADAVAGLRPPVFYKRQDKVMKAVSIWTAPRIIRAMEILARAVRDARLDAALGATIAADALFTIARAAQR